MKNIKYWLGGFLHNCIAHPAMQFLPHQWGNKFHDWSLQYWPPLNEEGKHENI